MRFVRSLRDVGLGDVSLVGGKNASLVERRIDSMSLTPDAIVPATRRLLEVEKRVRR